MSAVLLPGGAVRARSAPVRRSPRALPLLPACVLVVIVLLEAVLLARPQALLLHPFQQAVPFKQVSGYAMLVLLAFTMAFGVLRRHPALAGHQARLKEWHQVAGLLLVVVLAFHSAQAPVGFLRFALHILALATALGAARSLLGPRAGPRGSMLLLAGHIGLSCVVLASVLVHLWLVYAYTA